MLPNKHKGAAMIYAFLNSTRTKNVLSWTCVKSAEAIYYPVNKLYCAIQLCHIALADSSHSPFIFHLNVFGSPPSFQCIMGLKLSPVDTICAMGQTTAIHFASLISGPVELRQQSCG